MEEGLRKELQTYRERLHAFQEKSLGSSNTENNGNYYLQIKHLSSNLYFILIMDKINRNHLVM